MSTAAQHSLTELNERYAHITNLDGLLIDFENKYLLLKNEKLNIKLSHDSLAPLVQKAYRNSDAIGQKAARILGSKDLSHEAEEYFTEAELEILQVGRIGMRLYDETEENTITSTQEKVNFRKTQIEEQRKAVLKALSNGLVKDAALVKEKGNLGLSLRLLEKANLIFSDSNSLKASFVNNFHNYSIETEFQGHLSDILKCITNGKLLISLEKKSICRIWDLEGNCKTTIETNFERAIDFDFHEQSKLIAILDINFIVNIYKIDGKKINSFSVSNERTLHCEIKFSNLGDKILLTENMNKFFPQVWTIEGKFIFEIKYNYLSTVKFSKDDKLLIFHTDNDLILVNAMNGQIIKKIISKPRITFSNFFLNQILVLFHENDKLYSYSLDGKINYKLNKTNGSNNIINSPNYDFYLTYGDYSNILTIWSPIGIKLFEYQLKIDQHPYDVYLNEKTNQIFIILKEEIIVWNFKEGKDIFLIRQQHSLNASMIVFSNYFIQSNYDGLIVKRNFNKQNNNTLLTFGGEITSIQIGSVTNDILLYSSDDGYVCIYYLSSGKLRKKNWDWRVLQCSFYNKDNFVLVVSTQNNLKLWDLETDTIEEVCPSEMNTHYEMANISNNQKFIVSVSSYYGAKLWTIEGKSVINFQLDPKRERVKVARFFPEDKYILIGTEYTFYIYTLDGVLFYKINAIAQDKIEFTEYIRCAEISPCGNFIIYGTEKGNVEIIDIHGKSFAKVKQVQFVTSVRFSPCGKYFVTTWAYSATIYKVNGEKVMNLQEHEFYTHDAVFNNDSSILYTAGGDGKIKIWYLNFDYIIEQMNKKKISVLTWWVLEYYNIDSIEKAAGIDQVKELLESEPHEMKLYHYANYYYEIASKKQGGVKEYCEKSVKLYNKLIDFFPLNFYKEEREKVKLLLESAKPLLK